jgi:hypothetical protein
MTPNSYEYPKKLVLIKKKNSTLKEISMTKYKKGRVKMKKRVYTENKGKICSIADCFSKARTKGLCLYHYHKIWRKQEAKKTPMYTSSFFRHKTLIHRNKPSYQSSDEEVSF